MRYRRGIRFALNGELDKANKAAYKSMQLLYDSRDELLKSLISIEKELKRSPNKKAEEAFKILKQIERETQRVPDKISAAEKLLYNAARE